MRDHYSARRVKCDETQPACKRCSIKQLPCIYTLRWRPPEEVMLNTETLPAQTEPPNWDYMESIRYYFELVRPMRIVMENGDVVDPPFHSGVMLPNRFICNVVLHQIDLRSKSRGRLLRPGEEPASRGLWTRYYQHIHEHIRMTNRFLKGERHCGQSKAFQSLFDLVKCDIALGEPSWQAHINGCLAYAAHVGDVSDVVNGEEPAIFFRHVVLVAISADTSSPATKQSSLLSRYGDDELRTIVDAKNTSVDLDLLIIITRITRLRVQCAGKEITCSTLERRTREVLREIDQFSPEVWAKKMEFYHGDATTATGQSCQVAVRLYALLSLPRSVVGRILATHAGSPTTASARSSRLSVYDRVRVTQRAKLMGLLIQIWPSIEDKELLQWQLMVAGVALADGPVEERDLIERWLYEIWQQPLVQASPWILLEKLRAFWQSGKTGWEDCFFEPTPA